MKRSVDEVCVLLGVVSDGGDRGHDNGHAQRHGREEHDDVVRAVLQVQLLLGLQQVLGGFAGRALKEEIEEAGLDV